MDACWTSSVLFFPFLCTNDLTYELLSSQSSWWLSPNSPFLFFFLLSFLFSLRQLFSSGLFRARSLQRKCSRVWSSWCLKYQSSMSDSWFSRRDSHWVFRWVISAEGLCQSSRGMPRSTLTPLETRPSKALRQSKVGSSNDATQWFNQMYHANLNVSLIPLSNLELSVRSLWMRYSRSFSQTISY